MKNSLYQQTMEESAKWTLGINVQFSTRHVESTTEFQKIIVEEKQ